MNTYKTDSTKGLSKLQKDILTWITDKCREHPWANLRSRPLNLKKMVSGDRDENGELVYVGPSDASVSRAIKGLVRRGLIQKGERRDSFGGLRLKLSTRALYSFQPPQVNRLAELAEDSF